MKIEKWLTENTSSLRGKTAAVSGSTGGLGKELCRYLAELGASLILLDRNAERSARHREELLARYDDISVKCVGVDLEDIESVRAACDSLQREPIDVLIHNAGAYSIPRKSCENGLDNVFCINFVSPYYITKQLLPILKARGGRVVAVGSIAHNYSKTDPEDVDFSARKQSSKVYGNAKRYLMFSLASLLSREGVDFAITHPGIAFTNITAHYPRLIFAIIKNPMKAIFMKPKKAVLSIVRGVFENTSECEWIGPRIFDVWGLPKKKKLRTANAEEREYINVTAEKIYNEMR